VPAGLLIRAQQPQQELTPKRLKGYTVSISINVCVAAVHFRSFRIGYIDYR
jgi:hypothetical protein